MAWVGIGALLGLALCGLWWLSSFARDRAARAEQQRVAQPARGARRGRPRSPLLALVALGVVAVVLIGFVAFLVGIDRRGAASDASSAAPTTSATVPGVRRPPTTSVQILIQNASGFAKPASDVAGALRRLGYTIAGTVTVPVRAGSAVQCRPELASDALWLVYVLGSSTANEVFPEPEPAEAAGAGCIVVVGREL